MLRTLCLPDRNGLMAKSLEDFADHPQPLVDVLREGHRQELVIAFDQAIANTGWVLLDGRSPRPTVLMTGHITTEPMAKGKNEDRFQRAVQAYTSIKQVVTYGARPTTILHEGPVLGGVRSGNESSMIMCTAVRIAGAELGIPVVMVDSKKVKSHMLGVTGRVPKSAMRDAITGRYPTLTKRSGVGPLNEHVYDAIGVGLTYLEAG